MRVRQLPHLIFGYIIVMPTFVFVAHTVELPLLGRWSSYFRS